MSNINPFDDIEDMMIHARELAQMATEMVEDMIGARVPDAAGCEALEVGVGRLGTLANRAASVRADLIEAKRNVSRFFDLTNPGKEESALDSEQSRRRHQQHTPPTGGQGDRIRAQLRQDANKVTP